MKSPWMNIVRLALLATMLALPGLPKAQTPFPSKLIRLVTALPPSLDAYVRVLAAKLSDQLGVPVVVENRLGGNFAIAVQAVAGAPPDGHTLLIQSVLSLVAKNFQPSLPYEPVTDFAAITRIYDRGALVLLVRNNLPAKNLDEFIALVKASPGKLSYGSTGSGSIGHVTSEFLMATIQGKALHVPFKDAGGSAQGLLRGDIDSMIVVTTTALPQIRTGKVRALAVSTAVRIADLPDVPTLSSVVNNDLLNMENWTGLAAPARTPIEIVRRLNAETVKALADPGVRKAIESGANEPATPESPEQYDAFVRRENDKWREIVKLAGIKPE
ncbi:MAG: tripartite tricarboxylate transporter substrate binding protein [Betaproteobacteria bacterium]|nr:tripartite tricarboxylate transporter substrate binding protein [Betaproteobacteria bacterium]